MTSKVLFNYFEIRGKNFPVSALSDNGDGLKDNLSGCGVLTEWNFELMPDDAKFHWYAAGQFPFDTKNCIGQALLA
ncbi:hypothetical protein NL393_33940, partial [Klebsiella pneumoniae]|nr:hypothetical protein [Klebsiella pneumoniae]